MIEPATVNELMDMARMRPGAVPENQQAEGVICTDKRQAALAYAIWLNTKLPKSERTRQLLCRLRAELWRVKRRNKAAAAALHSAMTPLVRRIHDISKAKTGKRNGAYMNKADWDEVKRFLHG